MMWNAENAPTVVRQAHDLLTACTQEQFVDKVHKVSEAVKVKRIWERYIVK